MFHVKHIPSPRTLKLARFDRPDFRASRTAKHREKEWTWRRAVYRARRWIQRTIATVRGQIHFHAAAPVPTQCLVVVRLIADTRTYQRQINRAVRAVSGLRRHLTGSRRRSAPVRLSARRPGAHRLDRLTSLPSKAYMTALDARQLYVTANLLRLKGLASNRAFGEPSWREARRADHYATA